MTGALRRPQRGLLLAAGLVASVLATTASLVAADSLESLFVADVQAQWGTTDVVVTRPGEAVIDESLARYAAGEGAQRADGWAGRLVLPVVATQGVRREDDARLLGVSVEETSMGAPLSGRGRLDVPALGPEEVVVGQRLAERLAVDVGDRLDLVLAVPELVEEQDDGRVLRQEPAAVPWRPTVAGVADDAGVADLGRTPNLLARLDTVQRVARLPGKVSALHVSAAQPGRDEADRLVEDFEQVERDVGVVAVAVREDALDVAREEGGLFRGILLTLALLVVGAGAAVTANLVALLGQERSREVAVLRAVGVRRRDLRLLLTVEGLLYASAAAVVGTLLALPLAGLLARRIAAHFASIEAGRGREQVALALDARPLTVGLGLVLVLAVAGTTAWVVGRRTADLQVDAVLRGAPLLDAGAPSASRRRRTTGAGLLLLGAGLTAPDGGDLLRFLGLSLLLVAWWLALRARLPAGQARTALDTRWALGGLAWCVAAPALTGDFAAGVQSGFGLLTVAGAGAVGCATVLAVPRLPAAMRLLRYYAPAGRVQAALRTAGTTAATPPGRAATVVGSVATVLFMVAALAVLGSATAIPVERQRGGYDVVATSTAPSDPAVLAAAPGVAALSALRSTELPETVFRTEDARPEDDDGDERSVPYPVRAVALTTDFVLAQQYGLVDSLPAYPTATAALEAALRGRGAVLDRYSRPEGAQPGDDVVVDDGRGARTTTLLAVLDTVVLQAVLLPPADYDDLFRSRGPTLLLATAEAGTSPEALARSLEAAGGGTGLVARTVAEEAVAVVAVNRTFTDVFALVLQLGLGLALVSVGVLLARALRERRASLAVLRAVGLRRRDVTVALLAEPLLQAAVGCVLGLGVGLVVLRLLFLRGFADLAFVVDAGDLALACAGVLLAVLVVCAGPALVGARRDPAAALRDVG